MNSGNELGMWKTARKVKKQPPQRWLRQWWLTSGSDTLECDECSGGSGCCWISPERSRSDKKKKEGDDQKRKRRTHSSPVGKEDSPNPKARNGSRRLQQPFLWRQVCGLHAPNKTACQSTWFPIWAQNCFAWVACDKAQPNPELAWKTGRWQLRRTWRTTMKVTRTRELDRSTRIPCKS